MTKGVSPTLLVSELEQHLLVHGAGAGPDDYVFTSPAGAP
jgi:hypothetical protein